MRPITQRRVLSERSLPDEHNGREMGLGFESAGSPNLNEHREGDGTVVLGVLAP